MVSSLTYKHNKVKLCNTWDHYPEDGTIPEDDGQVFFLKRRSRFGQDGSRMSRTQEMMS